LNYTDSKAVAIAIKSPLVISIGAFFRNGSLEYSLVFGRKA